MKLKELDFSDLLISDDTAFLKGGKGNGQRLIPVPDEVDLTSLRHEINNLFITKASPVREEGSGSLNIPITLRLEYEGIGYRVADMRGIDKKLTWVLRRLPSEVTSLSKLGFPENFQNWLLEQEQNKGIILMTGSQVSGKTTLGSTLLAERLRKFGGHAITFEFPSELPLNGQHGDFGYCYQLEINGEADLALHIENAYRYARPNIVYIGEIRTKYAAAETLRMALSSSDQLIIATLHGLDIPSALEKLINWAREIEGINASKNLSDSILAVFHTDLENTEDDKILRIPEFLLVPFGKNESIGIRNKISKQELSALKEDITSQRNRVKHSHNNIIKFE